MEVANLVPPLLHGTKPLRSLRLCVSALKKQNRPPPHQRSFRIILTNAVKYVTNVESYDRRIQSAINIQGKKMRRRAGFLLTRAIRRADWR